MLLYQVKDYEAMSRKAASFLAAQILLKPDSVLGLATGSTPMGTYAHLVSAYKQGDLDFSRVTTVNLDEYCGLSPENPQSYRYFMKSHLFDHVNINPYKTFVPDGLAQNPTEACKAYDALLAQAGRIDMQLLGLGVNGHIGFNEPGLLFTKKTHCVELTPSTISANCRFFAREEDVPRKAYTMGNETVLRNGYKSL